jgi:hypothetical protein
MAPRRAPEGVPVPVTGFATRGGLRAVLPERVYSGLARPRLSAPGHPTGAAGVPVPTAQTGSFLRHPRGVPEGGSTLPFS